MAQTVDLIVDRGILFDIHILAGDIRLGLIVIVVGYEKLNRGIGKELPHLGAKLCRQGLIGLQNQGGTVHSLDDVRHGKGLARARHAKQRLIAHPRVQPLRDRVDCLRLIARRLERTFQLEFSVMHRDPPFFYSIVPIFCHIYFSISHLKVKVKLEQKNIKSPVQFRTGLLSHESKQICDTVHKRTSGDTK